MQRSCDKIADNEQDIRKVTTSEAFDSLDAVKCCDEIQGDMQINVMLNELVGKVETLRLRTGKQRHVHMFLRNEIVNYHN